jgi:protein-glutamine gamma-glutamyltransferase
MRFGLIHRIMTDALAALGIFALVTSGELGRPIEIAIVVGLALALGVPEAWQSRPALRRLATFGPIALLLVQAVRLFLGGGTLELAVEFAAALQIMRLATRRGAAHDQQVIVLSLLHLIAGTVLGGGLPYGLCFLGFVVVAPGALALSHLRREVEGNYRQGARDRTGLPVDVPRILRSRRVVDRTFLVATCLLALPIFLFTASLFILFPRIGLSLLLISKPRSAHMVGFNDKVDLGQVGMLRTDPTIALRVEIPDLPSPPPPRIALHLRGAAFDAYNGRSWSRPKVLDKPVSRDGGWIYIRRPPDLLHDRILLIDLEPFEPAVLFAPLDAVAVQVRHRGDPVLNTKLEVKGSADNEYLYSGSEERGVRYSVYLGSDREQKELLAAADLERYLAVPLDLSPRIRQLAHAIVRSSATALERARDIEAYLRANYRYDLGSPSGKAADPLDDFLFTSHRGHCEYYSTAMVVLLRETRVPARNVTGFIGGTYNRFGRYYAVRQGDAHSWVEAYIADRGWVTFDPTPPGEAAPKSEISGALALARDLVEAMSQRWDRYVVGYDLRQQVRLFESVSRYGARSASWNLMRARSTWIAALCIAIGTAGAYIVYKRMQARPTRPALDRRARPRQQIWATALYEALDAAMLVQGVARGTSTPPLLHARSLEQLGHPLGPEILDLTHVYIATRFGGIELPELTRRDVEARVRRVRSAHRDTLNLAQAPRRQPERSR